MIVSSGASMTLELFLGQFTERQSEVLSPILQDLQGSAQFSRLDRQAVDCGVDNPLVVMEYRTRAVEAILVCNQSCD